MYRVDMYYTIKTLLCQNKSQRKIAKELGIHRSTVKRLSNHIKEGKLEPPLQQRSKELLPYHDTIKEYIDDGLNGKLIHGTTRKVPAEVFHQVEKKSLQPLPSQPYEIMDMEHRKVTRMGHIMYNYNYYSVPCKFVGETLRVESNDKLLKMYNGADMVAIHSLSHDKGQYITREEHLPQEKRRKPREYYIEYIEQIGPGAMQFVTALEEKLPRHWHDMARGIIKLSEPYEKCVVNQACQRAFDYGILRYQYVKNICKNHAYNTKGNHRPINADLGRFKHDLSYYDKIV